MTNLEGLDKLNDELNEQVMLFKETVSFADSSTINLITLNLVITTYLSSIAKSLAIIADKMSEEKKED